MKSFALHPDTRPGAISLTVKNLSRSLAFYQQIIGLQIHTQADGQAALGADTHDLLYLYEDTDAHRYSRTTGLYHFAILLPNRHELARVTSRLFHKRYPNAPTDHITTKTTYLSDPDGHGIELYCESPEDGELVIEGGKFFARRTDGSLSDGREALDLGALFSHLSPDDDIAAPMPLETCIGHFHLHINNLNDAMHFYTDILGFDDKGLMPAFRMGMVSVDGYHHHIGLNTWQGEGASPAPEGAIGLRWFSLFVPDRAALDNLRSHLKKQDILYRIDADGLWLKDPAANQIFVQISPH